MSLRETLNKNQTAVIIGSIVVVVLAIGAAIFLSGGGRSNLEISTNPKAFYSSDDGKSFFIDDDMPAKIAPFPDKDGKTAYRCEVWSCDGGKTKQVVYLQKWRDDAKKFVQDAIAQNKQDNPTFVQIVESGSNSLVKLPGVGDKAENWVPISDPHAIKIMTPNCPVGSAAERVDPNQ